MHFFVLLPPSGQNVSCGLLTKPRNLQETKKYFSSIVLPGSVLCQLGYSAEPLVSCAFRAGN